MRSGCDIDYRQHCSVERVAGRVGVAAGSSASSDAVVLAMDTDLTAALVGDDLLRARIGLSLGMSVSRRSVRAGALTSQPPFGFGTT